MKYESKFLSFSAFLILLAWFLCYSSSIAAENAEDQREYNYLENSEKGPKHWGDLKKEWIACKNGHLQSPVDISNGTMKVSKTIGELEMMYKPSQSIIKNRGHDLSVQWPNNDAGSIKINGTNYFFQQIHWHSPSEHTINGKRYALELHMVHQCNVSKVKNNIAVIALLYEFGSPDSFLSKLMSNITTMNNQNRERSMGVIDPSLIKIGGNKYYRYIGSLTAPPCTEDNIRLKGSSQGNPNSCPSY
ncbi:hypothetical protein V6N12_073585 [Hibiscus sabdariffa]|uniref:Carbonic anhydrase n=1 Tax=Hibiscus sabdariffa TaxID=183260 RepID=A0ABR2BJH5_9ROSI